MKVIIINDLRGNCISTALEIWKRSSKKEAELWISKAIVHNRDFGDRSPVFLKKLKVAFLKFLGARVFEESGRSSTRSYSLLGVQSSLYSITNDIMADKEKYPKLYAQLMRIHQGAVSLAEEIIQTHVNEVALFNGRLANSHAIAMTCLNNNIKTIFYEWGESFRSFQETTFSPHNLTVIGEKLVSDYLKKYSRNPICNSVALNYIKSRLRNKFTKKYKKSSRDSFDLVLFLCSPHEYYAVDPALCGDVMISELELIEVVKAEFSHNSKIAVRAHPNTINDPSWRIYLDPISRYCEKNGIVWYGPDNSTSSYDLIRNSKEIAVSISTIGLDAFFLGAKVRFYGTPHYKHALEYVLKLPIERNDQTLELARIMTTYPSNICTRRKLKFAFLVFALTGLEKFVKLKVQPS